MNTSYTIQKIKEVAKSNSSFGNWAVYILGITDDGRRFDGVVYSYRKADALKRRVGEVVSFTQQRTTT